MLTTYRHDQFKWVFVDTDRGLVFLHHFDGWWRKINSTEVWNWIVFKFTSNLKAIRENAHN